MLKNLLFYIINWDETKKLNKVYHTLLFKEQFKYFKTTYSYHLVDPSPWPIVGAFGAFMLTSGGVLYMHRYIGGFSLFATGFIKALVGVNLLSMFNYINLKTIFTPCFFYWSGDSAALYQLEFQDLEIPTIENILFESFGWAFFVFLLFYYTKNLTNQIYNNNKFTNEFSLLLFMSLFFLFYTFNCSDLAIITSLSGFFYILYLMFKENFSASNSSVFIKIKNFLSLNNSKFKIITTFIFFFYIVFIVFVLKIYFVLLYVIPLIIYSNYDKITFFSKGSFLDSLKEKHKQNSAINTYHRENDFPLLYHFLNILRLSIFLGILYMFIFYSFNQVPSIILVNFKLKLLKLFFFSLNLNFIYDIYITLFSNPKPSSLALGLCAKCVSYVAASGVFIGTADQLNIIQPTAVNEIRKEYIQDALVFESSEDKNKFREMRSVFGPSVDNDTVFTKMARCKVEDNGITKVIDQTTSEELPTGAKLQNTYYLFNNEKATEYANAHETKLSSVASDEQKRIILPSKYKEKHLYSSKHELNHNFNIKNKAFTWWPWSKK